VDADGVPAALGLRRLPIFLVSRWRFFTRGFSFSFSFFSARFSTFFDGLPVSFSLGARVVGRSSSITRAFSGSSI
jgi:hypothetical protein